MLDWIDLTVAPNSHNNRKEEEEEKKPIKKRERDEEEEKEVVKKFKSNDDENSEAVDLEALFNQNIQLQKTYHHTYYTVPMKYTCTVCLTAKPSSSFESTDRLVCRPCNPIRVNH